MIQGKIRTYSPAANAGLVEDQKGQRYKFTRIDWTEKNPPVSNQPVIFEIKSGSARSIRCAVTANAAG